MKLPFHIITFVEKETLEPAGDYSLRRCDFQSEILVDKVVVTTIASSSIFCVLSCIWWYGIGWLAKRKDM